jgi:hypothetical protein
MATVRITVQIDDWKFTTEWAADDPARLDRTLREVLKWGTAVTDPVDEYMAMTPEERRRWVERQRDPTEF